MIGMYNESKNENFFYTITLETILVFYKLTFIS